MKVVIHTDGGARGNPGPAAVGVVIEMPVMENNTWTMKTVCEFGALIGEATNNVAEYQAVIEALTALKAHLSNLDVVKDRRQLNVHFFLDSTLVVNQLNGLFKVKDSTLRELLARVRMLEQDVGGEIRYTSIPRERNRRADVLVNQALDRLRSLM